VVERLFATTAIAVAESASFLSTHARMADYVFHCSFPLLAVRGLGVAHVRIHDDLQSRILTTICCNSLVLGYAVLPRLQRDESVFRSPVIIFASWAHCAVC